MPGPRFVAPAVRSLSIIWQANSPSTTSSSRAPAGSSTLNGSADLLPGYGAIDIAATEDGSRYGLLAVNLSSGTLELAAVSPVNDTIERRWTIAGDDWRSARVAASAGGFAVLHQTLAGTINATVIDVGSDAPVASYAVLDDGRTALDIAAADDALAILAANDAGELRVALVSRADGMPLDEQFFHSSSDTPRQLVAGSEDVGVLASNAAGAVTLEVRAISGGDARLLTAEATSPPPPPPPDGNGDNEGGGGGGAVSIAWLLTLLLRSVHRARCRDGELTRQRRRPTVAASPALDAPRDLDAVELRLNRHVRLRVERARSGQSHHATREICVNELCRVLHRTAN